ncbi:GL12142 [Drosophila persimilis]|nr:GL12142 [Drosophila persimilis]
MGINIPTREELIANKLNADQLARHVGADSLAYLSVAGLVQAVQLKQQSADIGDGDGKGKGKAMGHCTACLTGEYPGGLPDELSW